MPHLNVHQLSNGELFQIRKARWLARTDLTYLSREILGHKDVSGPSRFPFMNKLQKFYLPKEEDFDKFDHLKGGNWFYKPYKDMMQLPGRRRALILDPRGFLKTTINVQSHSIQWVLNYPDVAINVIQSTGKKAKDFLSDIKRQFQVNPRFRELFPEHCPQRRVFDWGNQEEFTSEARGYEIIRKEKTVMASSIDSGSAGYHYDVMKFSDIVEETNVKTEEQIATVIKNFSMMENLLVGPEFWIDVEGTRYDFSDLYGQIIDGEKKKPPEERDWAIHIRGCYKKDTSSIGGGFETFSPEEMDLLPYLYDENKQKISWWPERWSTFELEKRRKDPTKGEYLFACQQLNDPSKVEDDSMVAFPVNKDYPKWISVENFRKNIRVVHHTTTVDTAETKTDRSDYTAITTVAWDQAGVPYVVEIRHGKWLPDDIIDQMIVVQTKFNPLYMSIEETSYVRGFKDGLMRRLQLTGLHINFKFIKRETTISKKERILNTLQPWYKHGELRFLKGLGATTPEDGQKLEDWLLQECKKFPRFRHDDILDSLSDHFQEREWLGRLAPRNVNPWDNSTPEEYRKKLYAEQFDRQFGVENWTPTAEGLKVPVPQDPHFNRTGL